MISNYRRSLIIGSTTFVVLLASGFMAIGGSIIDSLTISIFSYIMVSILYVIGLAYIKTRGPGYVATDDGKDRELD